MTAKDLSVLPLNPIVTYDNSGQPADRVYTWCQRRGHLLQVKLMPSYAQVTLLLDNGETEKLVVENDDDSFSVPAR